VEDSTDSKFYYKYHHSAGDSMTMMNSADLDSNVVGIASFLYIIADL
jgi:carboxypeptidase Q